MPAGQKKSCMRMMCGRLTVFCFPSSFHSPAAAVDQWSPSAADEVFAAPPANPASGPVGLDDYFDRLDAAFSTLSSNAPAQNPTPAKPLADPPPVAVETDIDWFGNMTEGGSAESWDLPAPPPDTLPADLPLSYASPQPEASFAPFEPSASFAPFAPIAEAEAAAEIAPFAVPDQRLAPIEASIPVEPEPAPLEPAATFAAPAPPAPTAPFAPLAPAWAVAPGLELPLPNPPPLPALADAFAALLAAEQGEPLSPVAGTWPASLPPSAVVGDELIEDVTRRVLDRLSDTVVREAVAGIASTIAERLIREEIARIKSSIK